MKWMEMIKVRSTADQIKEIKQFLIEQRLPLLESRGLTGAYVLDNVEYAGDLSVLLVWDSENPPAKSREGYLLAEICLKLGPVGHGLWSLSNELEKTPNPDMEGAASHEK